MISAVFVNITDRHNYINDHPVVHCCVCIQMFLVVMGLKLLLLLLLVEPGGKDYD